MTKPIQGFFFRDFSQTYMPEILKEIYRDKVYAPQLEGKEDLVIVDAGANIGLWTYYAYPYAKIIYALEPAMEHYECLVTMAVTNGLDNVAPIKKALSNENGKAKFYHNENTTMYSLSKKVNTKNEFEEVDTITLDQFFKENKIEHVDFMKIDVEGAESLIFGSEGFDRVKDKIDVIMGEFHTWTDLNPDQFGSYFIDRGFTFNWVNKTEASLFLAERVK